MVLVVSMPQIDTDKGLPMTTKSISTADAAGHGAEVLPYQDEIRRVERLRTLLREKRQQNEDVLRRSVLPNESKSSSRESPKSLPPPSARHLQESAPLFLNRSTHSSKVENAISRHSSHSTSNRITTPDATNTKTEPKMRRSSILGRLVGLSANSSLSSDSNHEGNWEQRSQRRQPPSSSKSTSSAQSQTKSIGSTGAHSFSSTVVRASLVERLQKRFTMTPKAASPPQLEYEDSQPLWDDEEFACSYDMDIDRISEMSQIIEDPTPIPEKPNTGALDMALLSSLSAPKLSESKSAPNSGEDPSDKDSEVSGSSIFSGSASVDDVERKLEPARSLKRPKKDRSNNPSNKSLPVRSDKSSSPSQSANGHVQQNSHSFKRKDSGRRRKLKPVRKISRGPPVVHGKDLTDTVATTVDSDVSGDSRHGSGPKNNPPPGQHVIPLATGDTSDEENDDLERIRATVAKFGPLRKRSFDPSKSKSQDQTRQKRSGSISASHKLGSNGTSIVNDTKRSLQSRVAAIQRAQHAISFFQRSTHKFVVSQGDVDAKKIVEFLSLPKYEIAKVDHSATVPGNAFSHGYVRTRVEVRKPAIEMINQSFEKFHYRKSFWTIVPKLPDGTKSIVFADRMRRIFRKDTSEGDHESAYSDSGHDSFHDIGLDVDPEDQTNNTFFIHRARESVVLVRQHADDRHERFFDNFDIPDLVLPPGYDLLINPFFFAGEDYLDEVARDTTMCVLRDNFIYGSTLSPVTGRGFLLCFGQAWQDLIQRVTERCKEGREIGMMWPKFLEGIHSQYGPAPDYFDIPRGYWIYASAMLLGIYRNIGVREIWAAGGLVGMYSFARRVPALDYNREVAITFAMLREATWGCRSKRIGVRLLHYLPYKYHDDYIALCTIPWSTWECISRRKEWSYRRPDSFANRSKKDFRLHMSQRNLSINSLESVPQVSSKNILENVAGNLHPRTGECDDMERILLTASRYIVTVQNPKDRGVMNFMGAIGLEMIGIEYPTLIEDYMNVISESFRDSEDAREELRDFSQREYLLPGAVIRAANIAESSGGVVNVIQEGVGTTNGHIEWMRKYSFTDSISTLVLLCVASYFGWRLNTGVFHFLMAITVLTRINEEVAIFGTFHVLVKGRKFGYKMYEDSFAQFLVPAALGSVEAAYELVEDENQRWIPRMMLVIAGGLSAGIIFCTLLARLQYKDSPGTTFEEVVQRDGSIECLLTGENETGFRSIDHPHCVGVGPLQAQLYSLCESNGGDVASSTAPAPYHVSGHWMIAGTLQKNLNLTSGLGAASQNYLGAPKHGEMHKTIPIDDVSSNDEHDDIV